VSATESGVGKEEDGEFLKVRLISRDLRVSDAACFT
jgi:hypothetical protein